MAGDLIDKIYEAAFLPDLWPDVIIGHGWISGSVAGALAIFDSTMSVGFRATDTIRDFCTTNAWWESRRIDERLLRLNSLGFRRMQGRTSLCRPARLWQEQARATVQALHAIGLPAAALENAITVKTSQTYLARIFAKTENHQLRQLVAPLKSAQPLNGRHNVG